MSAHLERRDPLRALVWTILAGACWWLDAGQRDAELARELAADRAVIRAQGRQALANALLKLVTHPQAVTRIVDAELAISRLSVAEARIDQLLRADAKAIRVSRLGDRLSALGRSSVCCC